MDGYWARTALKLGKSYGKNSAPGQDGPIQDTHSVMMSIGPVIRVSPSELMFTTIDASNGRCSHSPPSGTQLVIILADGCLDIYQRCSPNQPGFVKDRSFYHQSGLTTLLTETDPVAHRPIRRAVGPAFGPSALKQKEHIVAGMVDEFVAKVRESHQDAPLGDGVDMKVWSRRFTFDVTLQFTFSASQNTLRNGSNSAWLDLLTNNFLAASLVITIRRLPMVVQTILGTLVKRFSKVTASREQYLRACRDMVVKRLEELKSMKSEELSDQAYEDVFASILALKDSEGWGDAIRNYQSNELADPEHFVTFLQGQAAALVSGGTETSSTFISATVYHMLTHSDKFRRLKDEVRTAFHRESDIDHEATKQLPYLHAVIEEGLRLFPPAAFGLPRISPGAVIDGVFVPKGVSFLLLLHIPLTAFDFQGRRLLALTPILLA